MSKIYLRKGREESLKRFHPWVFSGAIESIDKSAKEGDILQIFSYNDEFLGCAHYQIGSIALRILSFDNSALESSFWFNRISEAYKLRCALGIAFKPGESMNSSQDSPATNSYRLVHGEGDMLPGLIIDFYNGVAVIQSHSAGMYLSRDKITLALKELFGSRLKAVFDKSASTAPFKAALNLEEGYLYQSEDFIESDCIIKENGHLFKVDWREGQKTGFFLDQRENRAMVQRYSKGRRVLNLFCYTGGFSVYALAGGALSVDSVDSSAKAIELLETNIELNRAEINSGPGSAHNSYCTDAIEFIKSKREGAYDLIVVDPPAFAKHRGALSNALRAYQRLNYSAFTAIAPGGIIFTYSCSQVVDKISFAEAVFSAAAQSGRRVRVIDRLTQPGDHPVNIFHPEGEYLKGLVLFVE
jgi:23S rRNA (cytosine1962-C5)-methyltransferase